MDDIERCQYEEHREKAHSRGQEHNRRPRYRYDNAPDCGNDHAGALPEHRVERHRAHHVLAIDEAWEKRLTRRPVES